MDEPTARSALVVMAQALQQFRMATDAAWAALDDTSNQQPGGDGT
jgi:hypothetical protein